MLANPPPAVWNRRRNGCGRISSTTPVKSSASSSDRSSSDSNPCSLPVDTMNCSPGRWRWRRRQVNRRTGSHPAAGNLSQVPDRARHVAARSTPAWHVHRRDHPGRRPRRARSAPVP